MRQFLNTTIKRALIALVIGGAITAATWFVPNINLKTSSERTVTPTVASYYETCHGSSFNVNAPEITINDRGFPIAYSYQQTVPLCGPDQQTVDRTITETETNWLLVALDVLLWSSLVFVLIAKVQPTTATSDSPGEQ